MKDVGTLYCSRLWHFEAYWTVPLRLKWYRKLRVKSALDVLYVIHCYVHYNTVFSHFLHVWFGFNSRYVHYESIGAGYAVGLAFGHKNLCVSILFIFSFLIWQNFQIALVGRVLLFLLLSHGFYTRMAIDVVCPLQLSLKLNNSQVLIHQMIETLLIS